MSLYVQTNQPILLPDADYTVGTVDTGKIFIFTTVTALRTITLPLPAAGLHYKFINKAPGALGAAGQNVRILGGVLSFYGLVEMYNTVLVIDGAANGINFIATASLRGDNLDLFADGTGWSVMGVGRAIASFSYT